MQHGTTHGGPVVTPTGDGERHRGQPDQKWVLIAFLWFAYVLNHADRQVVYTLFPALQREFGFSNTVLGLTGALFLWVYGLCSPLAGIAGDRWPQTKLVAWSLGLWSAFTVLSGFAVNGTMLLTCRALLGISESFFMPAAFGLMANAHGPSTRSRAVAIFTTSQIVGVAVGGSLSGFIAERHNWRVSFWILGGCGLLFAIPLYRFLCSVPPHFRGAGAGNAATLKSLASLFRIPSFRIVAIYISVATFGLYLVYSWLPAFLFDKFGIGLARAAFEASFYPQVGTAAGLLVGGWAADRFYARAHSARFWIVLIAFLAGGPCIYLVGAGSTLQATRLAAIAFGFFAGFISGNQAPSAFDVVPASQRASAVGAYNVTGASISGLAPFLGGMARSTIGIGKLMAYTSLLYLVTAGIVLYAILCHFERDHRTAAERSDRELQ
ncbi:MAG: MFS transporter [Bryobacterales bacterium]|nr:MFS transporter [Bryobacterales bacterium]